MNNILIKTAGLVYKFHKQILIVSAVAAVLFASLIFRIEIKRT